MPLVPPSEPLDVNVVAVNETNVMVFWTRPEQPGSPALTGYKLCFNGAYDKDVKGESAEVGIPYLEQNNCYKVTVYAVSESAGVPDVKGPHSEPVWIVTGNVHIHVIIYCML